MPDPTTPDKALNEWVEIQAARLEWLNDYIEPVIDNETSGRLDTETADIICDEHERISQLIEKLDGRCDVSCGALCCFFNKIESSVPLSRHESMLLRRILDGKDFDRYYTFVPLQNLSQPMQDFINSSQDYTYTIDDVENVCMLNLNRTVVATNMLYSPPKVASTGELIWPSIGARACIFLKDDKQCSLQAEGMRFRVCGNFRCNIFLVKKILEWIGLSVDFNRNSVMRLNFISRAVGDVAVKGGFAVKELEYDGLFRELVLNALDGGETHAAEVIRYRDAHMRRVRDGIAGKLAAIKCL